MKLPKSKRPVSRLVDVEGRAVVVTLEPESGLVTFRLRGTRQPAPLPIPWLFRHAQGLTKGVLGL